GQPGGSTRGDGGTMSRVDRDSRGRGRAFGVRAGGSPVVDSDGYRDAFASQGVGGHGPIEGTWLHDRIRVRQAEGCNDTDRPYGRSYHRWIKPAPGGARGDR